MPLPLIVAAAPLKFNVPLHPLKVPLLTQLPFREWVYVDPSKVQDVLRLTFPAMEMVFKAVKLKVPDETDPVKFPAMASDVAGSVFVTDPLELLNVRLP